MSDHLLGAQTANESTVMDRLKKAALLDGEAQAKVNDVLTLLQKKLDEVEDARQKLRNLVDELEEIHDKVADALGRFEDGIENIKEGLNELNTFL